MELGQRLKQARLEAGFSQRQLCGDEITRNMLSQIENGSARPSMDTLRYLAGRLEKPVSFFLEETVVVSSNQTVMEQARLNWLLKDAGAVLQALEDYRGPDAVFDQERWLLEALACLTLAEQAIGDGRGPYAAELLNRAEGAAAECAYCGEALNRRILLLKGTLHPRELREIVCQLPDLDGELLLRARGALEAGDAARCAALLDAAENRESPDWNFLRGEAYLARQRYAEAAACYHKAEESRPDETASRLEQCYRELEDYKMAYYYARKGR